jgi:type I restriction enzyme R subunit
MRPVFSPTDFVQIKGRGTRKYLFEYQDYQNKDTISFPKERYKFFDFFATCEYFENEFPYDEKIKLPPVDPGKTLGGGDGPGGGDPPPAQNPLDLVSPDEIKTIGETDVGLEGMRIDREGFKRAVEEDVLGNTTLKNMWENGALEEAENYAKKNIFDKPKYFLNLDKIRKIFNIDRRLTVKEFLQVAFGNKESFEMKDDLLESEWQKFMEVNPIDQQHYEPVKMFFKAYATDEKVREIIASRQVGRFNTESSFNFEEYQRLNGYKSLVPQYIRDYAYQLTNL